MHGLRRPAAVGDLATPDLNAGVVTHELTHVALRDNQQVPLWLHEGVATTSSLGSTPRRRTGATPPRSSGGLLDLLRAMDRRPPMVGLDGRQAGVLRRVLGLDASELADRATEQLIETSKRA